MNINPDRADTNVMQINSGLVTITNTLFTNISSALFGLEGTKAIFDNITITQLSCKTNLAYCMVFAEAVDLQILNSRITDFMFNKLLMTIKLSKNTLINKKYMSNGLRLRDGNTGQVFVFNFKKVDNMKIFNSVFKELELTNVRTKQGILQVINSTFSNEVENRLLTQKRRVLDKASDNYKIQYLLINSSDSLIKQSTFIQNSLNYKVNGGVRV